MNRMFPLAVSLILTAVLAQAKPRTLPPSAFPELPAGIVAELEHRGCQIPQIQRHKRVNVIQGDFVQRGEKDWAALCMTKDETTLLVFVPGSEQRPMDVVRRQNAAAERWSITPISEQAMLGYVRDWRPRSHLPGVRHQGISSGTGPRDPSSPRFSDSAAETTIFYFDGSMWSRLVSIEVN